MKSESYQRAISEEKARRHAQMQADHRAWLARQASKKPSRVDPQPSTATASTAS